jgi:hypothetical protein
MFSLLALYLAYRRQSAMPVTIAGECAAPVADQPGATALPLAA